MKTIFVVAAILAVGALVAYALPTQVYADESETSTEQKIKQKNSGGDGSTNVNCADNDINSPSPLDVQLCGTAAFDLGELDGMVAGQVPE
jgi:hypothetical protein